MRAAKHHGNIGAAIRLQYAYSNALLSRGRLSEGVEHARRCARRADESGDEELRSLSQLQLAVAEGFVGNFDECDRALDEFFRGPPVRNDVMGYSPSAIAHDFRGYVLKCRGRMEEAARAFREPSNS